MSSDAAMRHSDGLSDFARARLVVYAVTACLLALMLFADPFHYTCNAPGAACPGCGFKTAVHLALRMRWSEAVESNALVVPAAAACAFACADAISMLVQRASKRSQKR